MPQAAEVEIEVHLGEMERGLDHEQLAELVFLVANLQARHRPYIPVPPITVITAHCLTEPALAAALLIRPDGHVAWAAGSGTPDPAAGMNTALRTWFSPRTPPQTRH